MPVWCDHVQLCGHAELDPQLPLRELPAGHLVANDDVDFRTAPHVRRHEGLPTSFQLRAWGEARFLRELCLPPDLGRHNCVTAVGSQSHGPVACEVPSRQWLHRGLCAGPNQRGWGRRVRRHPRGRTGGREGTAQAAQPLSRSRDVDNVVTL
jgi:hypothetical protein